MKNLIIIGAGGFAREVYWHVHQSCGFGDEWRIKGFLDGDVKISAAEYARLPAAVLGDVNGYEICADDVFTCAVGTPKIRRRLVEKISARGGNFVNIISTHAYIMPTVKFGRGVIICPQAVIGDGATVGDFAAINAAVTLGHDAHVGEFSCVMPHVAISGGSQIGAEVFIGSGAIILPHARIGDGATVGAGAVVLKKVRAGVTVFGNPAIEFS